MTQPVADPPIVALRLALAEVSQVRAAAKAEKAGPAPQSLVAAMDDRAPVSLPTVRSTAPQAALQAVLTRRPATKAQFP